MAGLKTTFGSHCPADVSLHGALSAEAIARYSRQATGDKFLVTPHGS